MLCGDQSGVLNRDEVVPTPAAFHEVDQRPGELPGLLMESQSSGAVKRREQVRVLNRKPRQRLPVVVESLVGRAARPRWQPDRFTGLAQEHGRGGCRTQVVIE